jgi:tRNA nucleotidyltransferase (CCA-adding enzyme)
LTKQFMRALGTYGSEARTGGFSGYLIELLVLRFGALRRLLKEAQSWRIPVDLLSSSSAAPRVPDDVALLMDDPVDPDRNVATALSRRNLGLFILAAGEYLRHPTPKAFELPAPRNISREAALRLLALRGTHVSALGLARPKVVDDILYPQLVKAEHAIADEAERLGFRVLGTASAAGESRVVVLLEVERGELVAVRKHDGPPAGIDRVGGFLDKWADPSAAVLQGPYVGVDGRLGVETLRPERRVEALLKEALARLPIGKDLREKIGSDSTIEGLDNLADSTELAGALGELLGKRLPWLPTRSV